MKSSFEEKQLSNNKQTELDSAGDLDQLPTEALLNVFSFFSANELIKMQFVCKKTHTLSKDDSLWKSRCNHDYELKRGNNFYSEYILEQKLSLLIAEKNPHFKRCEDGSILTKYLIIGEEGVKKELINQHMKNLYGEISGLESMLGYYKKDDKKQLSIKWWNVAPGELNALSGVKYGHISCALIVIDMEQEPQASMKNADNNLKNVAYIFSGNADLVFAIVGVYKNANNIKLPNTRIKQFATEMGIPLYFDINLSNKDQITSAFEKINESVIKGYYLSFEKFTLEDLGLAKNDSDSQEVKPNSKCRIM
jgi:hypothetical protein